MDAALLQREVFRLMAARGCEYAIKWATGHRLRLNRLAIPCRAMDARRQA